MGPGRNKRLCHVNWDLSHDICRDPVRTRLYPSESRTYAHRDPLAMEGFQP